MNIDPRELLIQKYKESLLPTIVNVDNSTKKNLDFINSRIGNNKGVFTVLITLALYKLIRPEQDIRQHKIEFADGFSGRSFDTKYVTPTLKELGLPSMAESGWLTRSLEQAYPYDENFNGKITPAELRSAFLSLVAEINKSAESANIVLLLLLIGGKKYQDKNAILISKINSLEIPISKIVDILSEHFFEKYDSHGGSKLPVLAFYSIYSLLMSQLHRFQHCVLLPLGSHTASDRTSKSAGDIQISKDGKIFEAVEIKLDKAPDQQMINIAYEKINRFSVERYYILSGLPIKSEETTEVKNIIEKIGRDHGCQVIVNGLFQTLKYYLRLIDSTSEFLNKYILLVENDSELKPCHKLKLIEILNRNKIV